MEVVVLMVERDQSVPTVPEAVNSRAIYYNDVQLAIIITIE